MLAISENDISRRIARDNPWWAAADYASVEAAYPRRVYFQPFKNLALDYNIRRATVLLGPRRVGKTVMIKQLVHEAILGGIDRNHVLYVSIDTPVYSGMTLEKFLDFLPNKEGQSLVLFDEIQYLKGWESHLKDLVDSYPKIKFVATGSAAAALRLKSQESGAGRFTDFMLPPLTFYEFLKFIGKNDDLIEGEGVVFKTRDINALNDRFLDYLNYGGYPEAVLNESIRNNAEQFIKNDIIDKVLLKDLPSLYGITEIQELNKLFSFLAYNAGGEASLSGISNKSGLTKPTITKYIEYLESAFLLMKVKTVDDNCRSLQRERNFKMYLNNPSMRAALFAPVSKDDTDQVGHLAESAIFSQWQHSPTFSSLRYARWKNGEVDIVYVGSADQKPDWIVEVKWSDRVSTHQSEVLAPMKHLLERHPYIEGALITSKTVSGHVRLGSRLIRIIPSALYCYTVGRNVTAKLENPITTADDGDELTTLE